MAIGRRLLALIIDYEGSDAALRMERDERDELVGFGFEDG